MSTEHQLLHSHTNRSKILGKALDFMLATCYMPFLQTLLEAIDCTYNGSFLEWDRDMQQECWVEGHLVYGVCAVFALLVYYPMATVCRYAGCVTVP